MEEFVSLKVVYQGQSVNVPDGTVAVIGADANATVRVARPGISRRHAIAKYDGSHWVVQDASSRNGTFHDGARIQFLDVTGPTKIRLGHPSEGELIELEPVAAKPADNVPVGAKPVGTAPASRAPATKPTTRATSGPQPAVAARQAALPSQTSRPRVGAPAAAPAPITAADPRLDDLVRSLDDAMRSIKGLTWSVWAMIAVTAILALLTLFVGIVAR
jgi:hypothetical protein